MKISCQSCAAKYTIADEKVVGKIVKIRCKKCSATIVINGNDTAALAAGGADTSGMPDFAPTESVAGEPWTVNVADGDQRTLTVGEIVQLYKAGIIVDDSYCWRDGMGDWLPLNEIELLHGACTARSTIEPDLEASIARPEQSLPSNQLLDQVPAASGSATQLSPAPSSVQNPLFGDAPAAAAAAPAAARRIGGGRAGGADLFGAVAKAGGDDDVMTSVPMSGRNAPNSGRGGGGELEEPKLTGQRNESSVLFSLSALTEKAPDAPSSAKQTEGSGLIDIRALAAPRSGPVDSDRRNKVDDIMNLGGGGAFSAALAAPVLAPPPVGVEASFDTAAPSGGKSNKPLIFAILGAACILALAMIFVMKGGSDKDKTAMNANGTAVMPAGSGLPDNGNGGTTTPAPPVDPAVAVANPANPSSASAPGTGQPLAVAPSPGKPTPATGTGGKTASRNNAGGNPDPDPTPPPPPPPPKPTSMNDALKQFGDPGGSSNPGASSGGSTAPFDRGAAAAALGAVNVASCKKSDGPTGSGHVSITFGSNGQVQTAVVDSPPFEGTSVGGCVAGKFRAAHVPGFSGGAQRVGKSFTIN